MKNVYEVHLEYAYEMSWHLDFKMQKQKCSIVLQKYNKSSAVAEIGKKRGAAVPLSWGVGRAGSQYNIVWSGLVYFRTK